MGNSKNIVSPTEHIYEYEECYVYMFLTANVYFPHLGIDYLKYVFNHVHPVTYDP